MNRDFMKVLKDKSPESAWNECEGTEGAVSGEPALFELSPRSVQFARAVQSGGAPTLEVGSSCLFGTLDAVSLGIVKMQLT